jgi:hypothetical protein
MPVNTVITKRAFSQEYLLISNFDEMLPVKLKPKRLKKFFSPRVLIC